ncbi:MAG: hypothetical protein ACXWHB_02480 [Usitatibacter sp.]
MMRVCAGAVLAAWALAASAAAPVAFVADVKGSATIEGDGDLAFLSELAPGTRLLLGTGAIATVTYGTSGAEFTLKGPGEFRVEEREVRTERGARPTRKTVAILSDSEVVAQVSRAATASVRMRSVARPPPSSVLEYPVDTRVTTLQPVLRWKSDAAAQGATVTLSDAAGREVWKGEGRSGSARPGVKLTAATSYRWALITPKGAPAEASFETLPAPLLAKVERSRAAAKGFPERVLHALLLQDLGAGQEARDAWAALALERPDLAALQGLSR